MIDANFTKYKHQRFSENQITCHTLTENMLKPMCYTICLLGPWGSLACNPLTVNVLLNRELEICSTVTPYVQVKIALGLFSLGSLIKAIVALAYA